MPKAKSNSKYQSEGEKKEKSTQCFPKDNVSRKANDTNGNCRDFGYGFLTSRHIYLDANEKNLLFKFKS